MNGCSLFTATALALLPLLAAAQPTAGQTFPALGAPAHPKVEVVWNRFHDVEGINALLRQLHDAHPGMTELVKVGESVAGREMYALEVTNEATGPASAKSAIYIDGNIHGNEVQGAEIVLYTAWYLLEMNGQAAHVAQLLEDHAFYLIPTINPDGRDTWLHGESNPHLSRGGVKPVDEDGDGAFDEDPNDDLDGDGQITRMRVRDPWGRWKADPDFPGYLMTEVKADERGEYTMLGWEGSDNDSDGQIDEDGPGGYDPNRNWPWDWQPEGVQWGAGDYPFSLPESAAVRDYVLARPNIAAMQSYHNYGGMILRSPGREGGAMDGADDRTMAFIAARGEKLLPGYKSMTIWKDLYTVWGGELDWFYGGLGILSFTNEAWTTENYYRRPLQDGDEDGRERAEFLRYLLQNQGLTAWHEVDHPQYGKIEVGGTSKNFGRVPPSFLLEEELHRNMSFTLYHAECMPVLRAGETSVEKIGDGVWRVRAAIENRGLIPTRTGQDVKNGITPRNTAALTGEKVKVLAAGIVTDRRLDVVEWQKNRPGRLLVDAVPGMSRLDIEFIAEGKGEAGIEFTALRGGTVRVPVKLAAEQ